MAAFVSRRQQARNEKALQDLVHSVPGNGFCADCQARNPGECLLARVAAARPQAAGRLC